MSIGRAIQHVVATIVTVVSLALVAGLTVPPGPVAGRGGTACEFGTDSPALAAVGFGEPNCCACDEDDGFCREVNHDGVASCTFEFCSDTDCGIEN